MCVGEDVRGVWLRIVVAVLNAKKRDVAEKVIVVFSDRQDFNILSSFDLCVEIRDLNLNPIKKIINMNESYYILTFYHTEHTNTKINLVSIHKGKLLVLMIL